MLKLPKNKTTTLWYDRDNPSVSIMPGHVTVKEFNKAYRAEGWHGDDMVRSDIHKEYWRPLKKTWKRSDETDKKAKPVSAMYW